MQDGNSGHEYSNRIMWNLINFSGAVDSLKIYVTFIKAQTVAEINLEVLTLKMIEKLLNADF